MGFYTIMKKLGLIVDAGPSKSKLARQAQQQPKPKPKPKPKTKPKVQPQSHANDTERVSGENDDADTDASASNIAAGQSKPLRLGALGTPVWLTSGPWDALVDLAAKARQTTLTPPITVEGISKNDEEVDHILASVTGLGIGPDSQYVRPFIRRKRLRCMLMSLPANHARCFWMGKSIEDLAALVPDQGEHLPVNSRMSIIELTNFFGFSLTVGPLLISMAACFWKGALDGHGPAEVEQMVLDPALSRISASMDAYSKSIGELALGLPCHPCPAKAIAKAPAEILAATPNSAALPPIVTPAKRTRTTTPVQGTPREGKRTQPTTGKKLTRPTPFKSKRLRPHVREK